MPIIIMYENLEQLLIYIVGVGTIVGILFFVGSPFRERKTDKDVKVKN